MSANPTIAKHIQASGYDTKSQDAWAFSSDSAIKLSFFLSESLSFHFNKSSNIARSESSQTIMAFAKQETGIRIRDNVSGDLLLKCATEDFRTRMLAIRTAALEKKQNKDDGLKLLKALTDFYRVYGTGFVSKLVLGAIGVFRGSITYKSTSAETKSNFGGGLSIGGFLGSASVAAEYAQNCMRLNAEGKLEAEAFGMPPGSHATEWADGLLNQFAGRELSKLADLSVWKTSFEAPIAHAEAPRIQPRPARAPLPEFKGDDIEDQIKNMKLRLLAEDWRKGHGGKDPSDQEYVEWVSELKAVARSANDVDVARMEPENLKESKNAIRALVEFAPSPRDVGVHEGHLQANLYGIGAGIDDVDFGGYSVVGYEYTPWGNFFPELKGLNQELTTSQVAMGLAMTWLSTRQLFAQYFKFCAKFFPDVASQGTSSAANAYTAAIDDITEEILKALRRDDSKIDPLPSLERKFREKLDARKFSLKKHYKLLIENYAWLKRVPFGAVPIVELYGNYYYQPYETQINNNKPVYKEGHITKTDFPASTLLEKGALRLYPVITTDRNGQPFFFWTNVEIVKLGDKEFHVGASICNNMCKGSLNLEWGMCRVHGETYTPGMLADLTWDDDGKHVPHLQPPPTCYDKPIWNLARWHDHGPFFCTVIRPSRWYGYEEVQWVDESEILADTSRRVAIRVSDKYVVPAGYKLAAPNSYDVCCGLVPVGYDDAKIASPPDGGFKGGVPMWFEPRTEEIVKALNTLGE